MDSSYEDNPVIVSCITVFGGSRLRVGLYRGIIRILQRHHRVEGLGFGF